MKINELVELYSSTCQPVMQRDIAAIVSDYIANIETGSSVALQPVHLSGYAGLGKTHSVKLIAQSLADYGVELVELTPGISPANLNKILAENLDSRDPVIFFADEIHTWPALSKNILKIITETGGKRKEISLSVGKETFDRTINPAIHWFITASNESVKDSALVGSSGRFQELQFLPYDREGKERIFRALLPQYAHGMDISENLFPIILKNVRPFARSIKSLIQSLRRYCQHGGTLETATDVATALLEAGYMPGGWSRVHVDILRYIAQSPAGRQVQEIAMSPCQGRDRDSVRGLLDEMVQGSLIITLPNGRKGHTQTGLDLLNDIEGRGAKKRRSVTA